MAIGDLKGRGLARVVRDWLDALDDLDATLTEWASRSGWSARLAERDVREGGGPRYAAPVLELERGDVEIAVVPIARGVPDADGLVELYLMPDFDLVASLRREGTRWMFHYAPPLASAGGGREFETERFPLDEAALDRVLNDIAAHA